MLPGTIVEHICKQLNVFLLLEKEPLEYVLALDTVFPEKSSQLVEDGETMVSALRLKGSFSSTQYASGQ